MKKKPILLTIMTIILFVFALYFEPANAETVEQSNIETRATPAFTEVTLEHGETYYFESKLLNIPGKTPNISYQVLTVNNEDEAFLVQHGEGVLNPAFEAAVYSKAYVCSVHYLGKPITKPHVFALTNYSAGSVTYKIRTQITYTDIR